MTSKIQIAFRNMESTEFLIDLIEEKYAKLRKFHTNIIHCSAVISRPHRSQRNGNQYHVRVSLLIPGKELVGTSRNRNEDSDIYTSITEAFIALESQLKPKRTRRPSEFQLDLAS